MEVQEFINNKVIIKGSRSLSFEVKYNEVAPDVTFLLSKKFY